MRTKTIELFTFDELDNQAKQRAIENWRDHDTEWCWTDEWQDSLKVFCRATGIKTTDWEVSLCSHSFVRWEFDNWPWLMKSQGDTNPLQDMTGLRLRTWLINNWLSKFTEAKWIYSGKTIKSRRSRCQFEAGDCPLTGYCGDMALIDPILKFIKSPDEQTSLASLIDDCFDQWIKEWIADMEFQQSDEYIIDALTDNEYEFTADGQLA